MGNQFVTASLERAQPGTLPHLSHSRISRYLTCPEQYRLYYIEGFRPKVPSASLAFGSIIHQSIATLLQKGDSLKCFSDGWGMLETVELAYGPRDSWAKLRAVGEKLLNKFVTDELPKIKEITAVEQPFEIAITDFDQPLVGVIDLKAKIDAKTTVVDFKTAAASYGSHEAALADQLTAYSLSEPDAQQLALCVLIKTEEPKIEWHVTSRTGEELGAYLEKVGYIANEITASRFYKRPGMWCTWCDFLPVCLGNAQKVKETLVRIE